MTYNADVIVKTHRPYVQEMNNTHQYVSTISPASTSQDVGLVYDLMATVVFVIVICILLLQFMIFVFRQQ